MRNIRPSSLSSHIKKHRKKSAASSAVPAMVQQLSAPVLVSRGTDQQLRTYATNAIRHIQPEALTNNPVK